MTPHRRNAWWISLGAAGLIGFFVAGGFLNRAAIGLDPSAFPLGSAAQRLGELVLPGIGMTIAGLVWTIASLLAAVVLAVVLMRRAVRADAAHAGNAASPSRRTALASAAAGIGALAVGGVGAWLRAFRGVGNEGRGWAPVASEIFAASVERTAPRWAEAWKGSRVKAYRRLGRTNFEVSDIVLGTGAIRGEDGEKIARLALERGVNYFDTAPDYSGAGSEDAMGRAMKSVQRDQLFIATKFCTPGGHLPSNAPVSAYLEAIEGSLRRLGTDYVDLVHIHSCDEIDRLMSESAHEAFDRLKEQGKARFLGVSTHTPNLVQVATKAIDSNRFDVMMLAYHHGIWAPMNDIIRRAHVERDMGIVAMKTLKGARHENLEGFRQHADSYAQSAFRWVLSNPDVSCLVVSFFELQHVDEYLAASGGAATPHDVSVLEEYDRQIVGTYCAPHCGVCLDRCPEGLAIHDVLRHRMYFEDYGWEKEAMRLYAKLGRNAEVCASCSAPCLGSCPVGIPIQERMIGAHERLSFDA
jgi:predicted aldo/keto reductase-like oxidoreductase